VAVLSNFRNITTRLERSGLFTKYAVGHLVEELATSRNVEGSILDEVFKIFIEFILPAALRSTQPLTEMSTSVLARR
jgi:hypothetical protein